MKLGEIYAEDCVNLLSRVSDEFIDLTVTSPPYGTLRDYDGFYFDVRKTASLLFSKTKVGGALVWLVGDQTQKGEKQMIPFQHAFAIRDAGFILHDYLIWEKDTLQCVEKKRYGNAFEHVFVFSRGTIRTFNPIEDRPNKWAGTPIHGTTRGADGVPFRKANHNRNVVRDFGKRFNVWRANTVKNNKTGHPAPFPAHLVRDFIVSWSNPGDIVFDPFMGSGTTALVAQQLDRRWFGCDVSEEYCRIARERVAAFLRV